MLGRYLLYLACHYYILEVALAAAFKATMSEASNPEVLLFTRFQAGWGNIEQDKFQHGATDGIVNSLIEPIIDELLVVAHSQLDIRQPREDYLELIELFVISLGGVPSCDICFLIPGPMHHAWWMNKVIYSLKIWMFRAQFRITTKEEKGLNEVSVLSADIHLTMDDCLLCR